MKKKLVIIRSSYRPDGGAEQIISRIIAGLKQQFVVDVSIITRQWDADSADDLTVISCLKRGWFRHTRFNYFIADVTALLKQHSFDWVQSHERIPGCKIYRAGDGVHKEWLEVRKRGASSFKAFLWKHSLYHKAVLAAEKALFEHPDLHAVICNSTQIKKDILKHYPQTDPEKLKVIYNGIDLDKFSFKTKEDQQAARLKLGLSVDSRILLFVGSGFQRKGLDELLVALAQTQHWQLIVVGKDKHRLKYQKQCYSLGINDRVTFAGLQSEVIDYYSACDLLVHPALYDPAPNVILEAMACGRGVIVSSGCGNHDLVSDEGKKGGFIYQSGDIKSLVSLLESSLPLLDSLSKGARMLAKRYSLQRMVELLVIQYESIKDDGK